MLEADLLKLIKKVRTQKSESNNLEVKAAKGGCPKLFDTLSSFSNNIGGGTIVFGIDESNGYNICGVYDAADLQKKIMEQSLQMEPVIRPLFTVVVVDGKTIVSAEIQEVDEFQKPCFYKGTGRLKGAYIRVGDADRLMTEYEVYSYEAFRRKIHDELRIADRAELTDIETPELAKYKITLAEKKANLSKMADKRLYKLQGFAADGKPTLAGIMLFCDYPQGYFPQLCITAVVVPGTETSTTGDVGERFIDNKRIDGTIGQMFTEAYAFIKRNMRNRTIIDTATGTQKNKPEYPHIAVRELLLNALIHRDYSVYTENAPITVTMFSDRLVIENPGGLYGRVTLDSLGKAVADTRNPYIAGAMETMGITENRYSGIPTVRSACAEMGLEPPKFESERGVFRVTIHNAVQSVNSTDSNTTATEEIAEILTFCSTPKTRTEIAEYFDGRLSINYVMTKFIHPLLAEGKLKLTLPETPKSKKQRYVAGELNLNR
jgi:ATP-dependent DNA helicase RecG